jgi:predicted dehydrogenase
LSPAKVRWGVLGAAHIALQKVIPAMQRGEWSHVAAIASREPAKARAAAAMLGIETAHGSYDALLDDPTIEAVYIPLPNHLHVPWAIRAAERGKHVLCEKPIALSASEAQRLVSVRDATGVKIQEAFMVRSHPQWQKAVDLVRNGSLGQVQAITGYFGYHNVDPSNVRNVSEFGGGGLMDIGCYLIHTARWLLDREPRRVAALVQIDEKFGTDRQVSMMLDFDDAQMIGVCGTQLAPSQRVEVLGATARLEIEIPFNAPPDRPCRIFLHDATSLVGAGQKAIEFAVCDQYTLQGDEFSRAIRFGTDQALPLEDSVANMRVLDAVRRAGSSLVWETP